MEGRYEAILLASLEAFSESYDFLDGWRHILTIGCFLSRIAVYL